MLDVRVLTIFPSILDSFLSYGNPARASQMELLRVQTVDFRDFTTDKHRTTDDYPYGGGSGMVMKLEPVVRAIRHVRSEMNDTRVILMTPQGKLYSQELAEEYASLPGIALVCGRYEGLDERVRAFVDEEISVGDYVLSGGETAAMIVIDSISRLIPGVLGTDSHTDGESFYKGLLEYPQYTRPKVFEGIEVPKILLEGHHEKIRRWRKKQSLDKTAAWRPDLIANRRWDAEELEILEEIQTESRGHVGEER
jgi:tRNA (guanine37-N1)-methyltransferase